VAPVIAAQTVAAAEAAGAEDSGSKSVESKSAAPSKASGRYPVQRAGLSQEFVPPRTAVENTLVEIWSDVLKLEGIGIEDNFFDLNGDSLIATQIVSRVKAAFGDELSLRDVLTHLTIAEFAQVVETKVQGTTREFEDHLIPTVSRDIELPLSFSQERLWLVDHLISGSPMYNLPMAVRLGGPLNISALEQSFSEVTRRHEILRTTFAQVDGRPVQIIGAAETLHLDLQDFSHLPESTRESEALRAAAEASQKPFDLANNPAIRISLIRVAPDDHMLVVVMHHIVSDAWSMGLLIRELAVLYSAFSEGKPSSLPELPIQYADFAYWQRQQEERMREQLSYWKQQLNGAPPVLELPSARPRPEVQTFRGARHSFTWDADLTASAESTEPAGRRHFVHEPGGSIQDAHLSNDRTD
jgi:acyl carrier protein